MANPWLTAGEWKTTVLGEYGPQRNNRLPYTPPPLALRADPRAAQAEAKGEDDGITQEIGSCSPQAQPFPRDMPSSTATFKLLQLSVNDRSPSSGR
ncbi:hypothetical protein MKX08_010557 [Trichoderma sp. CBMAI-0020]|nr:hypothetical protein MKX08_010557 [Trichoderma sp. CBMAI-0020]